MIKLTSLEDQKKSLYLTPNLGLTKREHFAGLAMQGWIASNSTENITDLARWSIKMADALIAELNKETP